MGSGNTWRSLPEQQIIQHIMRLEQRITYLENRTLRIPILESAPEEGDPANIWAYEDGRLNFRNGSGDEFTYQPQGRYTLPALGADPGAASQINFWVGESTGRLYVRGPNGVIASYNAIAVTDLTGTPVSPPPPPKPTNPTKKTYTTTWNATWTESYQGDGNRRTNNNHLMYGRYASDYGSQASQIGFNHAAIKTALTEATVSKVEIYLYNLWSYWNDGVDVYFGAHNNSSRPNTYSGQVKYRVSKAHYGKPQAGWRTISNWFGESFKSGTIKGVLLDPRDGARSYYGYAAGISDGGYTPPRIRITYTK